MKAYDVLQKLYSTLPQLTNYFSEEVNIVSVVGSGTDIIAIETDQPHLLDNGSWVDISGITYNLPIDTLKRFGKVITIVTLENHDFTLDYQENAVISGANEPEFNGTFKVAAVPNRKTLLLECLDSGAFDGTGSMVIEESTGYQKNILNGIKQVVVVDDTNFTYQVDSDLTFNSTNGIVTVGFRMGFAMTVEDAVDMYTKQNQDDYWLFVKIGSVQASKDRNNNSDAIYVFNQNTGYRQQTIHGLSIYVVATTTESISAMEIVDSMEDVYKSLIKSLCGNLINDDDYYTLVFDSHRTEFYDRARYCHVFDFQTVEQITNKEVFSPDVSVAFRDVFLDMTIYPKNIGR